VVFFHPSGFIVYVRRHPSGVIQGVAPVPVDWRVGWMVLVG
jgi:hypothetical protein